MDTLTNHKYVFHKYLYWTLILILTSSVIWYEKYTGDTIFTRKDYLLFVGIIMSFVVTMLSIININNIKLTSIDTIVILLFFYSIGRFSVLSLGNESLIKFCVCFFLYFSLRQYKNSIEEIKFFILLMVIFGSILSFFCLFNFINLGFNFPSNFSYSFGNSGIMANYLVITYSLTCSSFFRLSYKTEWLKLLVICFICLQFFAILLTGSRTALLSINVVSILILSHEYNFKQLFYDKKKFLIFLPLFFLAKGLIKFKYFSFLGRLLIYKVSFKAIWSCFLIGYGVDTFSRFYNYYQIQYFEENKALNNEWLVADSMKNACSDFIQYFFELGFIGISLILAILYLFIKRYNSKSNVRQHGYSIYVSLLGLLICGCFSYPSQELSICLIAICLFTLIINNFESKEIVLSIIFSRITNIIISGILIILFILSFNLILAKKEWSEVAKNAQIGILDEKKYDEVYLHLKWNKRFLYNYGCELSKHRRYLKSIKIIEEAMEKTIDEKLLCFQAENYCQVNRFAEAENLYIKACNLVPSRYFPKYFLMVFYINMHDDKKALALGKQIIEMPEKKRNNASIQIKLSTRFLIDSLSKIK